MARRSLWTKVLLLIIRHMLTLPADKLAVWMGNLPMLVGALATFSTAPYGIGKIAGMFKKEEPKEEPFV